MRIALIPALLAAAATSAFCSDPELMNLVMTDAHVVAGINVQNARNTTFGRFVLDRMQTDDKGLSKLAETTGFDPRRDLDEIMLASTSDFANKSAKGIALVRGRFDQSKIATAVKTMGPTQIERRAGFDIYTSKAGNSENAFVFLTPSLAAAGDLASVRETVDRKAAGKSMNPETAKRVQTLSAANDVWMLSTVQISSFAGPVPMAAASGSPMHGFLSDGIFRSLDQAAMGFHFGPGSVEMNLETVSKTEKDATALADVVRLVANLVQMQRDNKDMAQLAAALEAMQLSQQAKNVSLKLAIPQSEIERMFDQGKSVKRI